TAPIGAPVQRQQLRKEEKDGDCASLSWTRSVSAGGGGSPSEGGYFGGGPRRAQGDPRGCCPGRGEGPPAPSHPDHARLSSVMPVRYWNWAKATAWTACCASMARSVPAVIPRKFRGRASLAARTWERAASICCRRRLT